MSSHKEEVCNYYFCVEAMRTYIVQYLLPHAISSCDLKKRSAEGRIVNLTVELHPLRIQPTIQRFTISEEGCAVGIVGVWHHGIEELFYAHNIQGQTLSRSLRHRNDETIEQGLRWLCLHLLRWGEHT